MLLNLKVLATGLVLFSLISPINQIFGEEPTKEEHSPTKPDAGRSEADLHKTPEDYNKLLLSFEKINASLSVNGINAGQADVVKKFDIAPFVEKFLGKDRKVTIDKESKGVFEVVLEYRKKLEERCKFEEDVSTKAMAATLDGYIKSLLERFSEDPVKQAEKGINISEKMVNTYTIALFKMLDEKAKIFEKDNANFKKSDEEFKKALLDINNSLWGDTTDTFTEKRKAKFDPEKSTEEEVKKVIGPSLKAIEDMKHQAEKSEKKVCKIDDVTAPGDTENTDRVAPPKKDDGEKQDPSTGDGAGGGAGAGAGGAGAGAGAGAGGGAVPFQVPPQNPFNAAGVNDLNGVQAALDAARLQAETAAQQAALQEKLFNDQLNRNDQNNALANQALQDALANAQRPNNNRSAENSEQGPQISPQLGGGGSDKGQQPQPQPFPEPPPPPQGNPFLPFMAQSQPQQLPLELFKSNKPETDEVRRKPIVVEDPKSTGLLELLKVQQQMLQNMLWQRQQGPYGQQQPGVMNVGNRLQSFGGRMVRGGGRRGTSTRIYGTANSGAQGTLQVKGARGPLPAALTR
jgi:hypothetical protein